MTNYRWAQFEGGHYFFTVVVQQRYVDYVHYNPVKHGLVERVEDWPWSMYHRYILEGVYPGRPWHDIQAKCEELFVGE